MVDDPVVFQILCATSPERFEVWSDRRTKVFSKNWACIAYKLWTEFGLSLHSGLELEDTNEFIRGPFPICLSFVPVMHFQWDGNTLYCYTSDRNVRLWLVQIASRGVS